MPALHETMPMNGKASDHPVTDILVHGLPAFIPKVDALIKEINEPVRRWDGQLVPFLGACAAEPYMRQLRENGRDAGAGVLLHNLAWSCRRARPA